MFFCCGAEKVFGVLGTVYIVKPAPHSNYLWQELPGYHVQCFHLRESVTYTLRLSLYFAANVDAADAEQVQWRDTLQPSWDVNIFAQNGFAEAFGCLAADCRSPFAAFAAAAPLTFAIAAALLGERIDAGTAITALIVVALVFASRRTRVDAAQTAAAQA